MSRVQQAETSRSPLPLPPIHWRMLGIVLLAALLVRGGVLVLQGQNLAADVDDYRKLARSVVITGDFRHELYGYARLDYRIATGDTNEAREPWTYAPTAYRSPLYPLVLSCLIDRARPIDESPSLVAIALLHLGLGLGTVLLTFLAARKCGLDRAAYLAALLVAFDPILLKQSTVIMTETLAAFLAVLCLYLLAGFHRDPRPWNAGLAGGAAALAALCRPVFFPWMFLVMLALPFSGRRKLLVVTLNLGAYILIAVAVYSPWVVRNYLAFGNLILTTTHGGATLLAANNDGFYDYLQSKRGFVAYRKDGPSIDEYRAEMQVLFSQWEDRIEPAGSEGERELFADRTRYQVARERIAAEPGTFLVACCYRLRRLWGVWPYPTEEVESTGAFLIRQAIATWYIGLWICLAAGVWGLSRRIWQPPWLAGSLMVLTFMAVHAVYWTDLRMRAPLMPFLAIVASLGASEFYRRWRALRRET